MPGVTIRTGSERPRVERYRRVVLLGFMASGKSEVGRRPAARLGWRHLDLDREIERHAGTSIARIFETEGEAAFRALEVELTPRFAEREEVVLSPGGGWVTNPGLLDALPAATLTVWLKVSPEEVVRRLGRSRGAASRPLLRSADPKERAGVLLTEREPLYARAAVAIETDGREPEEIALELESIIRGAHFAPAEPKRRV